MRAIPQSAVTFVAGKEGLRTRAYLDSAGIWTLGYGHIEGVKKGDTCTKAQALAWLAEDMKIAQRRLYAVVKPEIISELTEGQWSALLSFTFNLGANASWKIWKRLNARQFDLVPAELHRFVNAGGKRIQGLVNRRAAEVALWQADAPGTVDEPAPPSSVTRSTPTPPTPTVEKPLAQSKTMWTAGTVAAAGVVQGAQQIQAIAGPQSANHEWIGRLAGFAAVLIVAGGLAIMVFKYMEQRSKRV